MKNKTILVTGGAGFIGSHLCEHLLQQGHKVFCLDSFYSGKKENVENLFAHDNFILIKHDIVNPIKFKFDNLDEIYNLACPASPMQYQFDPILTTKISVDGIQNVLNLARKYGAKIIQASTSEVYGDPLEHPQKETYFGNVDPIGKRSCYDEGKRTAESLCKDYNAQFGSDVRIIRLFNVYGPHMMFNDGRVVSNFVLQALSGEDITIHGKGEQTRSFLYIDDLVDALIKVMSLPREKIGIGPVNIGNPDERSIKDLAYDIKNISESSSKIDFIDYDKIPERLGDPQQRKADISKLQSLVEWSPKTDFNVGIRKTIDDFKSRIDNKTKILIFAPVFSDDYGPAEEMVKNICEDIFSYDFYLITSRMNKKILPEEKIGRIIVHRVGFGISFDKYLLPILGPIKAFKLNKKNDFQVIWGVMASYGSLAAVAFSFLTRKAFLLSLFEGKLKSLKNIKGNFILPFYKVIFAQAHRIQILAEMDQQQIAWLEDERNIQPIDLNRGRNYVAKKTKEKFQELEILTSRL